ncbi:hypothetical protein [Absidia glauca]|uniref:Peroxisomal biogenesis factor 11 n=1 Tax=Absidia glauca TaxID=4829 RepID=A0A163JLH5_ABSGL|nr:hypothetical protein [Absidia glauca]
MSTSTTEKQHIAKDPFNPLAIAKHLGASTPRLDHLLRFLNSVRGTDKVLMFIQYWSKILIFLLHRRGGRAGVIQRIQNFAGPVSDFRILLRYYGLLPMVQYMNYIEHHAPPSAWHQTIERLQNWANVIYYPLEHIYWLGAHQVIPLSQAKTDRIGIWSCRFWASYVVLEYVRLLEQYRLLRQRETSLVKRIKAGDIQDEEDPELEMALIKKERTAMVVNTCINSGYLPLTVHWSLENSTFPDVMVGVCGGFAAIFQIYAAWRDTA